MPAQNQEGKIDPAAGCGSGNPEKERYPLPPLRKEAVHPLEKTASGPDGNVFYGQEE